ncbi:MAG: HAMP domain-containing histidine kinase [Candidatus Wildermuthbacteria bacterium]|nr:HAMP domain-containing histidine kinase [Candidatus Wildermuthbacteria bacterium]
MRFSLQLIVGFVVALLLFASVMAVYFAASNEFTLPLTIIAIINMEAVLFFVFLITRGVLRPLEKIRAVIKKVGEGDFAVRVVLATNKELREFADSINDMISRLQTAKKREEEVEKLKTEFVSLAAHQLRTPLSQVKWTIQLLGDQDLGKLTKEQQEIIKKMGVSNEKMIQLVNDLLNVARIEEGRYLFQPSDVQLEEVVSEVVQSYKEVAERKKIQLVSELPPERLKKITADKEKIQLAVQNLIDNALRYTKEKGVVSVRVLSNGREAEVSVQDNGIGIPEDQKQRVFERFFRARNAKMVETQGTGLGLYLAKNIMEAHGGRMWFESEESKGTTFHLSVPFKNN